MAITEVARIGAKTYEEIEGEMLERIKDGWKLVVTKGEAVERWGGGYAVMMKRIVKKGRK